MTDTLICSLYGLFSVLLGYIIKSGSINELHTRLKYFQLKDWIYFHCSNILVGHLSTRWDIFLTLVPLFMFWKLLLLSSLLIVHKALKFMVFSWPFHAPSGGVGTIAMLFPHIGMLWTHVPRHCAQLLLLCHVSLGACAWGWRPPKAPIWFEPHITIKLTAISPSPWKPSSSGRRKDPGSLGIYTICLPSCSLAVFTMLFPPLIL